MADPTPESPTSASEANQFSGEALAADLKQETPASAPEATTASSTETRRPVSTDSTGYGIRPSEYPHQDLEPAHVGQAREAAYWAKHRTPEKPAETKKPFWKRIIGK